jgi:ribosomal protein S6--L-glutamate ligase
MRFGVISAWHDDWHAARVIHACRAHGEVDVVRPTMFSLQAGPGQTTTVVAAGRDARRWDVWLTPRALGDRGDHDFQCVVYAALEELGLPVVNPVPALLTAVDKARSSWLLARAGVPTPPARAVQSVAEGLATLRDLGSCVAKPPFGSLGIGVRRIDDGPEARPALARMLRRHKVVYLQRWVEPPGRDLRLFVVGDRVEAAIARVAPPGEFRTNLHAGGSASPLEPDRDLARLAITAARAVGLEYAGVDCKESPEGPTVLEVNGTPRWDGIHAVTGLDMAGFIVAHAATLARHDDHQRRRHG